MTYGPFYAARNKQTGELFTSLRGKQVFNAKGPLTNAMNQWRKRRRPYGSVDPEDYEVFEISMIDTKRLQELLDIEFMYEDLCK